MKKYLVVLAGAAMLALPALGQTARPLRLFFSQQGLSDPNNTNSNAVAPSNVAGSTGTNPSVAYDTNINTGAVRFYVWAQILGPNGGAPAGPNNATFNGVSLRIRTSGPGTVTGMNFWNYSNGTYGSGSVIDFGRWQQFDFGDAGPDKEFSGGSVIGGAGVNNTGPGMPPDPSTAQVSDRQYLRTVGGGRADVTLLGYVEVTPNGNGVIELKYAVGTLGIALSGNPEKPAIYRGCGDAAAIAAAYAGGLDENNDGLNDASGASQNAGNYSVNPLADASIIVIPEPASLALLALAGLVLRRR
jgi:hypothetical protein